MDGNCPDFFRGDKGLLLGLAKARIAGVRANVPAAACFPSSRVSCKLFRKRGLSGGVAGCSPRSLLSSGMPALSLEPVASVLGTQIIREASIPTVTKLEKPIAVALARLQSPITACASLLCAGASSTFALDNPPDAIQHNAAKTGTLVRISTSSYRANRSIPIYVTVCAPYFDLKDQREAAPPAKARSMVDMLALIEGDLS